MESIVNAMKYVQQPSISTRIQIRIPHKYKRRPIIYHLASYYLLEVNILAALLTDRGDGWFDLEISGSLKQISRALCYLAGLDVEVLHKSTVEI